MKSVLLLAAFAACASGGPHVFGQYNDLSPRVQATKGERIPQHLTVQVAKPANIAVFLVVPGRGSTLLFPADSAQSGYMQPGAHQVETSFARAALNDTSRLIRRPADNRPPTTTTGRGRNPRDTVPQFGFNQRGYLLIYASQEALQYSALANRVSGISIPIEDNEALTTVTKLIRESTRTTGTWAAMATDFPP